MNISFFKKCPIKLKSEFIRVFANKKILRDETQRALLIGPIPYLDITGGITADHSLLKIGNKKFGNKKHRKKTNK